MLDYFKSWSEIKDWCEKHKFHDLANRLQLNNDCWMSSGEFGRDQVAICDAIRYTADEDEAIAIANELNEQSKSYMKF